jgi:erythromycin esterase-like protein
MKDAIKTAKEQFKNCTWYGDAGEALPARHVAPLFAEINRLRNKIKALCHDLSMVKISLDHKTTLLDSCEKALVERDEKNGQLREQVTALLSGARTAKTAINVMKTAGVFSSNYLDAKMAEQIIEWLDESINDDSTEEGLKDD